jgi:hypothetical protein
MCVINFDFCQATSIGMLLFTVGKLGEVIRPYFRATYIHTSNLGHHDRAHKNQRQGSAYFVRLDRTKSSRTNGLSKPLLKGIGIYIG